ncbi:MAG: hypothetical protein PHU63_02125 [Candidatus ainarchaeum sp.]|nr:hypothetical protein [Candidatus ainarchaeum sp.]
MVIQERKIKIIKHFNKMETLLEELAMQDDIDSEKFENSVFPLIEEILLLKETLRNKRKIRGG